MGDLTKGVQETRGGAVFAEWVRAGPVFGSR